MISIEAILAIAIFSFVPVAIKFTAANPYTIGIFRLIIAAFCVLIWWRKKIKLSDFFQKQSFRLLIIGVVFFCHWITYFYAIKIGGPSACVIGMSTYGIQLVIWGSLFLNYHLRPKNIVALIVVIIGVVLVLPAFKIENNFTKGLVLGLISAAFYSTLPILHQKTNQYFKHEIRIFSQFFFAMLIFLFFLPKTNWNLNQSDWLGLIFLAVFGTLIAHSLWAKVTSHLPTYISGIIYYAITPTALILSHLVFHEVLSQKQILGALLIIAAAIYNVWGFNDQHRKT